MLWVLNGYVFLIAAAASLPSCSRGPYLYDAAHNVEGIGSATLRMKTPIVLAKALNLSYIPNPAHFLCRNHQTNLFHFFGWDLDLECSAQDVQALLAAGTDRGQEKEANRRTHIQLVRLTIDEKHTTISSNFRQLCTAMAEGKSFIARNIGSRKRSLNRKVYREKVVQKLAF